MSEKKYSYSEAGVDLRSWENVKRNIGDFVKMTYNDNVLGKFGQFGGLYDVSFLKNYKAPVLVSSVDGVGTKLKVAASVNKHDTVGEDIVNHCVDDILVMGAKPLWFLDYIGTGTISTEISQEIVRGLARACKVSDCVLIGGETAEMPDIYSDADYDLAGTIVGVVEKYQIIDGRNIEPGDVLIGLHSNGLHTNGYTLARKVILEAAGKKYGDLFSETGRTFGEELLRPHRSYISLLPFMYRDCIKGCAHITGGGFKGNVNRILPDNCDAVIKKFSWTPDPIFSFIQKHGNVDSEEMYSTFNMGIGMVLAVKPDDVSSICYAEELRDYQPCVVGRVEKGDGKVVLE